MLLRDSKPRQLISIRVKSPACSASSIPSPIRSGHAASLICARSLTTHATDSQRDSAKLQRGGQACVGAAGLNRRKAF
eukprot:6185694-Pleurochrysis_carterae.AAC.2